MSQGLVYVDECVWPYGRMKMCHMIADSTEALHSMADRIGVARRWFHNKRYPHYDICKAKRAIAVGLGAVQIDRKRFVELTRKMISPTMNRGKSQEPASAGGANLPPPTPDRVSIGSAPGPGSLDEQDGRNAWEGTAPKPVEVNADEPCPIAGTEVTAGKTAHLG